MNELEIEDLARHSLRSVYEIRELTKKNREEKAALANRFEEILKTIDAKCELAAKNGDTNVSIKHKYNPSTEWASCEFQDLLGIKLSGEFGVTRDGETLIQMIKQRGYNAEIDHMTIEISWDDRDGAWVP